MNQYIKIRAYYLKKAFSYIRPYKKLSFIIIIFSLLASLFEGISIGALIPLLQNLINQGPNPIFPAFSKIENLLLSNSKEDTLIYLLLFVLITVILKNIFTYLNNTTIQKINTLLKRDLQRQMFNSMTDANYSFYQLLNSGNILSSVTFCSKSIVSFIFAILSSTIKLGRIIVYTIILFLISWPMTLAVIFLEIALMPIIKIILSKIKNINTNIARSLDKFNSKLIETIANLTLIKISSTEKEEKDKFAFITEELSLLEYKELKYHKITPFITETFILTTIVIILILSIKVYNLNVIPMIPFIIAYLYVFLRLFQEINGLLTSVSGMFQSMPPFRLYEERLYQASKYKSRTNGKKIKNFKNKIELKNITFHYKDNYKNKNIIKNITISFPKGSFTAIVGPTGSGKTTLINLISGLIDPDQGNIIIDGHNLKEIDSKNWLNLIGFISQNPIMFNESIYYNISYGAGKVSESDIIKAAKIANIHDFIMSLPHQYNTIISERGINLSGGQKQRLAIARAIIRNPKILILDEATSSLDSATEKDVQEALEKAMKNRTVIAIAHRLSTIKKVDNIIVLDKGQIIEQGNHKELIDKNDLYKKYYELQFKD